MPFCFRGWCGFSGLAKSALGRHAPGGRRETAPLDAVILRLSSALNKRQSGTTRVAANWRCHPSWSHCYLTNCCSQLFGRTSPWEHQECALQTCESGDGVRKGGGGPGLRSRRCLLAVVLIGTERCQTKPNKTQPDPTLGIWEAWCFILFIFI